LILFLTSILLSACLPGMATQSQPQPDTTALLESMGGYPCPDSNFTCVDLTVPLDHVHPEDGRTTKVVFGVLPATGERKGIFVTVTGGPGTAGLSSADGYTAAFDPGIPEHFDIIFFDQRGVGQSGGLQCAQAATAFYLSNWDATTPAGEQEMAANSQTFAQDCVVEMGNPEILPYLGTNQAIEDLNVFRQAMGDDQIWLYGESYGTQYAQAYAAAHPDTLAGLILDGTVDLTLSGTEFLGGQARAFNEVLQATLEACNNDEYCAEVMGVDAVAVYDELAVLLKQAPQAFDFPLPSGGPARREFTFSDLETSAAGYMYSEGSRMIFLRALGSYARNGDLVLLARTLYDSLSIDPETLVAIPDPTFSDAIYYAVECQDYVYFSGTAEERAEAYLSAGDSLDTSLPRFASIFYGDLPCVYWPQTQEGISRPAPLTAPGIPTLVLNATTDPATPYSNAQAVFSRLEQGYLVTETGGPHVIFGWGNTCVDDLVTTFLVDDQLPAQQKTVCDGIVADDFVPLAPLEAADFASPLDALASVDDELYYLPEYYYWDLITPTTIGCPAGGSFTFESIDMGEAYTLTGCTFSYGFSMTGIGSYNYDEGVFTLNIDIEGLANGRLVYTRDSEGVLRVTGEYNNQAIDISE
jgi:pimeloyl-ACP methyl ester carboxylesterase